MSDRDRDNVLVDMARADAQEAARRAEQELHQHEIVRQQRNQWIAEHGSAHLKRLVQEGIDCEETYRLERLAHELPDWEYHPDALYTRSPSDPPPEAMLLLDEARRSLPEARLEAYRLYSTEGFGNDLTEIGFVPVGSFLGRDVVYRKRCVIQRF